MISSGGGRLPLPTINITGDIHSILIGLEGASKQVKIRKARGWQMFQSDEEWRYIPINDKRLCYKCEDFAGDWRGNEIRSEFENRRMTHPLYPLDKNEAYPNTHESYKQLRGICRCRLVWQDYMFTLLMRLDGEMRDAMGGAMLSGGYTEA